MSQSQLRRTALYEEHQKLGGRLIDFGGWELPVQYSGLKDEHLACRSAAGLFDVSHMGEINCEGPDAAAFLDFAVTNLVSGLAVGQALYTVFCHDTGGIIDDLVIYRRGPEQFFVVVNASNTDKDFAAFQALQKNYKGNFRLENQSARYSQIAIQGPRAAEILQTLTDSDLASVKTYRFTEGQVRVAHGAVDAIIARTGYTGEDGFEVYCAWSDGPAVWAALIQAGTPLGLKPCGLGARDTLRLEMKYPLYGHELSDTTHPLEAGLGWVVKMKKPDFVGKKALEAVQAAGVQRKLVGIAPLERVIPRQGYRVLSPSGELIGEVTSGTHSPSLDAPIAIAYVATPFSSVDSAVQIEVRGKLFPAKVIPTPFYSPKK